MDQQKQRGISLTKFNLEEHPAAPAKSKRWVVRWISTDSLLMESNNSNVDNSTFNGNLTPANVPIDGGMTESIVGTILALVEDQRPAYQDI